MSKTHYLQGKLLVAMPSLHDSEFEQALIYVLEHNDKGAIGLVINRALTVCVDDILEQVNQAYQQHKYPDAVLHGGPVETGRGFILHASQEQKRWKGEVVMPDGLSVTTSVDVLHALAQGEEIGDFWLVLGYAGWSAGQLEQELLQNAWLAIDAAPQTILAQPTEQRLSFALSQIGVQYHQLSDTFGHA